MTGIDLNRAGTPLLEIVSEPDMRSSAEAVAYAARCTRWCAGSTSATATCREARSAATPTSRCAGRAPPSSAPGARSRTSTFRFLQQAIDYEVQWQIDTLEDGGRVHQATVLFDPDTGETRMMRSKEDAHDYRYFPDPDLLPLVIAPEWKARAGGDARAAGAMKARFMDAWGLSAYDATTLTASKEVANFYQATVWYVGAAHSRSLAPTGSWAILPRASTRPSSTSPPRRSHRRSRRTGRAHRGQHDLQRDRQEGVRGAVERRGSTAGRGHRQARPQAGDGYRRDRGHDRRGAGGQPEIGGGIPRRQRRPSTPWSARS